ncbi:trypsin-like serine protease [Photobacterium sp. CAIM 1938]|uniref:trypsin-like serine protease n=3 Tax=Photobacterium lucens TaxID=2562949 RepID=UPI00136FE55A|nr:trypsin-like serine protease [Photobacterium lucens]MZG79121.1 trypsin-like serine protease [Photobacterium lucens]
MISFVKSSVSMLLFAFSALSYAESPPPIIEPEIDYKYNVNVESYNPNTLTTTNCQGTLISPSWVLTGLKCIKNVTLSETHVIALHSNDSLGIHLVKKAYKFKKKKFALLQLDQPVATSSEITLLREPLLPEHGRFAAEVVQGLGYSTAFNIKGKNKKTARHNTRPVEFEKNFKGGAWVLKTHNLGDVQIGLTHTRYQAIQTASIANKIDRIVNANSGETVNWIDRQTLLDTLACEADGSCIEPPLPPECPEGVMDCGNVCDWNDCTEPPLPPECPEGVMDCGNVCDWNDCTEPPLPPECPEGVMDCGNVCDWNDCTEPPLPPECPEGVMDCGHYCDWNDCTEPPLPPECPEGVMDCGNVCDWNDCTEPPLPPECPEGVMDCGHYCDWNDCTEPPVITPECPEGVMDCGDVCDWNDCSTPEVITEGSTAYRAPYIINNDVMTIHNRPLMS